MRVWFKSTWGIGRGINRKGFNFKLAMVKTCSTWPLLNKYPLWKNFEVGLQTPPSPQTPYIAYEKGQKLEIWILFLAWSKCIHSSLKEIIITFKQKIGSSLHADPMVRFYVPNGCFWSKMVIFSHLAVVGYVKRFKFSIKCPWCFFWVKWNTFGPLQK